MLLAAANEETLQTNWNIVMGTEAGYADMCFPKRNSLLK